jgi:hypothetical protein
MTKGGVYAQLRRIQFSVNEAIKKINPDNPLG